MKPITIPFPPAPTRFAKKLPTLQVATELKSSGRGIAQEVNVYPIGTPVSLTSPAPAWVTVDLSDSRCVNYNTTRVGVTVTLPCDPTERCIDEAKAFASRKALEYLEQEKQMVGGTYGDHAPAAPPPPAFVPPPPVRPVQGQRAMPQTPPPSGAFRANTGGILREFD